MTTIKLNFHYVVFPPVASLLCLYVLVQTFCFYYESNQRASSDVQSLDTKLSSCAFSVSVGV